ncbi:unnamed protein product [Lepeophtheirus salmonis]|uniref:(salmon louse) hypothetical protein n=1 Tax=Lepeophtheirus salmonis TaxID=72036 RepID=A0A7R8CUF3_LEPSM|nr:unnamed protein product [Lepeophtheirus salmonis]CAF2884350.1 unnamed protein product [Lepeophtheirus salmonis]
MGVVSVGPSSLFNVSGEENEVKKPKKVATVSCDTVAIDQIVMDVSLVLEPENIGSIKTKEAREEASNVDDIEKSFKVVSCKDLCDTPYYGEVVTSQVENGVGHDVSSQVENIDEYGRENESNPIYNEE